MELSPMHISILLLLTEIVLTGITGVLVYLFRQVSAARREHLEQRIEMAKLDGRMEAFSEGLMKLEHRFEKRLESCLDAYFSNLYTRHRP
jgi:hypothetical protein